MKNLLIASTLLLLSISVIANENLSEDYVSGTCTAEIKNNKSEFKPLRKSVIEHNFKVLSFYDTETTKTLNDGRGRVRLEFQVVRVMPNIVNIGGDYNELATKKNQILLFLDDKESMDKANSLTKDGQKAIDNYEVQSFDEPISIAFTYNGRGQEENPRIRTSAMSMGSGVDSEVLDFTNNKTVDFEIETKINFKYRNFEDTSFLGLGIGSDKSANERLEQDGWKTHKGKFEMKCTFTLNKPSKKTDKKKEKEIEAESSDNETLRLNKSLSTSRIELNNTRVIRE